jgi:redox-sensitive bicupin YhaK (pirin superfamily)
VQFSSAGSGVKHSEDNESPTESVKVLQVWVLPWKKGLGPVYRTQTFAEEEKRKGFLTIISPLKGGVNATPLQEKVPEGVVAETIPIHADFLFGAGIIPVGEAFAWKVAGGKGFVTSKENRQV